MPRFWMTTLVGRARRTSALLALVATACSAGAPVATKSQDANDTATAKTRRPTRDEIEVLRSLGYVDRTPTGNPEVRGVTAEQDGVFAGLNLYNSRHRAMALLIDMGGRVVHTWSAQYQQPPWMHTQLEPDGSLLVLAKEAYIAKLDWSSRVVWKRRLTVHHDFALDADGTVWALTQRHGSLRHKGMELPFLEDQITVLSSQGAVRRTRSIFPLLRPFVSRKRLERLRRHVQRGAKPEDLLVPETAGDLTHTNSIHLLGKPIPGIAPTGAVLLSVRELDRIFILDPGLNEVLWSWGQGLSRQHHATHLSNGNIMVYDNGLERGQGRVLEIDPVSKDIVWSFTRKDLFTVLRGAAQELPNRNVLITESDSGHVLEVTRAGEIVWEFWNPDVLGGPSPTRAVIYRMTRYAPDYLTRELLARSAAP